MSDRGWRYLCATSAAGPSRRTEPEPEEDRDAPQRGVVIIEM